MDTVLMGSMEAKFWCYCGPQDKIDYLRVRVEEGGVTFSIENDRSEELASIELPFEVVAKLISALSCGMQLCAEKEGGQWFDS